MNGEEIIRMAQEAGIKGPLPARQGFRMFASPDRLRRFAALIAAVARAEENEACAELVVRGTDEPVQTKTLEILRKERERIATAIRARGQA